MARAAPRPATKREQIAGAARSLFLAQGYAGTTMDGVTAAAGVSKQTVYAHFPGKADLLAEVLSEEIASLGIGQAVAPEFSSLPELRCALLDMARTITDRLMRDEVQQLLRLVIGEVARLPELRDVVRDALPGPLLHEAESVVRAAVARGLVDSPRPDLSARMLVGPLMSFVVLDGLLRADGATAPDGESLAYVVDAFLAGVRPGGRP